MTAADDAADDENAGGPERDEVLSLLEDGLREAHRKVVQGRVHDAENEKVRIQWIRALAYAAGQYRQLRNDEQLDELAERIEEIEQSETNSGGDYRLK